MVFAIAAISVVAQAQSSISQDKSVILIGSDGLSADVIRDYPELFPNIIKLFADGSGTLESRSVLPSSSAVNWASHLMGAGPELHGYTDWGSKTPELPSRVLTQNGTFPDITWLVRQKYPNDQIGVVYSWGGIGYLFDTTATSYNYAAKSDREVVDKSLEYLKKKPRFAFFYLAEPDGAGHSKGWESQEYKDACVQIDKYVGELMAGIKAEMPSATVIFVSDHGGIKTGHGGKTMNEMLVPFVIVGEGVKKGYKITDSQMVFDTAPTIAYLLGCDAPQVWIGRPVMSVFEPQENIQVSEGQIFEIVVDENPTTGYQWSVQSFSKGLESLGSKYKSGKSPRGMVGVGGKRTFLFKSVGSGMGKIVLELKRSWEEKAGTTKSYNVVMSKK